MSIIITHLQQKLHSCHTLHIFTIRMSMSECSANVWDRTMKRYGCSVRKNVRIEFFRPRNDFKGTRGAGIWHPLCRFTRRRFLNSNLLTDGQEALIEHGNASIGMGVAAYCFQPGRVMPTYKIIMSVLGSKAYM